MNMNNVQLAAMAYQAGFGKKSGNQLKFENFKKLKDFAASVRIRTINDCAHIAATAEPYASRDLILKLLEECKIYPDSPS